MTHYQFTVVLEPDREEPHRYNVRVPALPGCLTYGESIEDALANVREAITVYVESLLCHRGCSAADTAVLVWPLRLASCR